MPPRFAVCLSVDARMLVPGLYVAHTVRKLSRSNDVDVIVVTGPEDADDTTRAWLERSGILHCNDLDMSRLEGIVMPQERLTPATMVRLLVSEHFAGRYEKILFLDADLTIHDDVTAIFALDTGPHALAAVPAARIWADASEEERISVENHFETLGMTRPFRYFNAGVLYFDVEKWNQGGLTDRVLHFLRHNAGLCFLPSEHPLNAVLDGDIAELSPIWNFAPFISTKHLIQDAVRPVIIHHAGPEKPWKRFGAGKRVFADLSAYRLYKAFLSDTPWPDWLDRQWTVKDLRQSISWEYRRMSRMLRGKPLSMQRIDRPAYADAFIRRCADGHFADVTQGITSRENGRLRLNPNRIGAEASRSGATEPTLS